MNTTNQGSQHPSGRLARGLRNALAVAGASFAVMGANAATTPIFDTFLAGPGSSPAAAPFASGFYAECFVCTGLAKKTELGDIITFGGTSRQLSDVNVTLNSAGIFGNGVSYAFNVDLTLYTVNTNTGLTAPIAGGKRTVQQTLNFVGSNFDVNFEFGGLTVPNTIYYGLSVYALSPTDPLFNQALTDAIGLSLWDLGPSSPTQDGLVPLIGDDTLVNPLIQGSQTRMFGRVAGDLQTSTLKVSNLGGPFNLPSGPDLSSYFTGNVQFNATVPEPQTYLLVAFGLLAIGGLYKKRKAN